MSAQAPGVTRNRTAARWWHGLTALVAGASLVAQFVVILNDGNENSTVVRYFSYFTILSNIAVCAVSAILARQPDHDGPAFRVFRLAAVVCISVTGVVHYNVLRPLPEVQDLTGWSQVCDIGLHIVVPILVLVGWLAFGPRPRIDMRTIAVSILLPVAWLAYTLVHGAVSDWYPYPFVDMAEHGYGRVLLNCLGVAVVYLVCCALAHLADRKLPPAPRHPSRA
ncbi:MAG: Pr6Pr family membrane protein [Jiangellaceae bacterium]